MRKAAIHNENTKENVEIERKCNSWHCQLWDAETIVCIPLTIISQIRSCCRKGIFVVYFEIWFEIIHRHLVVDHTKFIENHSLPHGRSHLSCNHKDLYFPDEYSLTLYGLKYISAREIHIANTTIETSVMHHKYHNTF